METPQVWATEKVQPICPCGSWLPVPFEHHKRQVGPVEVTCEACQAAVWAIFYRSQGPH